MKAVVITSYGDISQLNDADIPMPLIGEQDVLVEIRAASVNAVDWKIRSGYMKEILAYEFPLVLGLDIAGVVKKVGAAVSRFKVGDAVLAKSNLADNGGYAAYTALHENLLEKIPNGVSFEKAAALPLAGMTAWQALTTFAGLTAGERVLIQGGAGGIGSFAIQFAKALGAKVIATASTRHVAWLKRLGVDHAIVYDQEDFAQVLRDMPVDVVLDAVGGEVLTRSYGVLKRGGRMVSIQEPPNPALEEMYGVKASFFVTLEGGNHLNEIVKLMDEGKVDPLIRTVLPLTANGIREAHSLIEDGHTYGKIVLA
ncbi:NADP-dependent oxidoreductase [Parapedobacter soli]|uniref:NADP-dependent oxidoreductase n=1 Tax=Parapedobacter soli TaxID=416955 RepID=UPI0021C6B492|nr:NADP-dependent oxidoreductase [Parapedobacter soli]